MPGAARTLGQQLGCLLVLVVTGYQTLGQEPLQTNQRKKESKMSAEQVFEKMVGDWEGECKTWFEPGKLADTSKVKGEIRKQLNGKFFRHTYQATMLGKPRKGEETLAYNSITKDFQVSWFDDFHMSECILFSVGPSSEGGFSVMAKYDTGADQPQWGWRTQYEIVDEDHLVITAYNITPDGQEAKAVETSYARVKAAGK